MSICQLLFLPIIHAIVVLQPVPKSSGRYERVNSLSRIQNQTSQEVSVAVSLSGASTE